MALAARGFQPKPYHNADEVSAYNGTKIQKKRKNGLSFRT